MSRRKNAGEGYGYMFHGAFKHKADAVAKERKTKGAWIKGTRTQQGMRYLVMSPRTNPIKRKPKAQKNPLDLVVMGANPHEIIAKPGETITIRVNPVNPLGFHPGLLSGKQQRAHYGRQPYNRRVAGLLRRARGHKARVSPDLKKDVQAALVNQGYRRTDAKRAVSHAQGGDFNSLFTDALNRLRENPICGAMIGGERCTRKPGHRGPHLPQGATMRPRSRLRRGWKPNPSAAALHEKFTGKDAEWFTVSDEPHMPAGDYADLGQALALYVKPVIGGPVQQINFGARSKTRIVSDESARQIYFVGGDQDVSESLTAFGAIKRDELYELGHVRRIDYRQRKEHVPDPEVDGWRHEFGEETGVLPTVLFDPRHKKLLLVGGAYVIREEGIVN